mgnify:CR=1 FL=1
MTDETQTPLTGENILSQDTTIILNKLTSINKGRDLTDVQTIVDSYTGIQHLILGFIYAKQEVVAYINTETYVGELFGEMLVQEGTEAVTGASTLPEEGLLEQSIGFITVEDLCRLLEDMPNLGKYLTLNESGILH